MNNSPIKQKAYNKWIVFLLVTTAIFMSTLDSSIVNIALPYIMEDLHTRVNIIQWVILAYLVSVSSLLLTFGRLSDTRGRKIIYTSKRCILFIVHCITKVYVKHYLNNNRKIKIYKIFLLY